MLYFWGPGGHEREDSSMQVGGMKATRLFLNSRTNPHGQSYRQRISHIPLTEWISAARTCGLALAEEDDGAGSLIRKGG